MIAIYSNAFQSHHVQPHKWLGCRCWIEDPDSEFLRLDLLNGYTERMYNIDGCLTYRQMDVLPFDKWLNWHSADWYDRTYNGLIVKSVQALEFVPSVNGIAESCNEFVSSLDYGYFEARLVLEDDQEHYLNSACGENHAGPSVDR
ncbi:Uncharacterised protein r2_g3209 [Pycnogonum litorale]